jgi:hypothetical protein
MLRLLFAREGVLMLLSWVGVRFGFGLDLVLRRVPEEEEEL